MKHAIHRLILLLGLVSGTLFAAGIGDAAPELDLGPALKRGKNCLEITVSNTQANALSAPGVEARVTRCFPPRSPYEDSQRSFEQDSLSGGLFGPVRFGKKANAGPFE